MTTLTGKDAGRFIRNMIKKEKSPLTKKDKKLAEDIKKNEHVFWIWNTEQDRKQAELMEIRIKKDITRQILNLFNNKFTIVKNTEPKYDQVIISKKEFNKILNKIEKGDFDD
jgi:hypothetical protein